MADRPTAQREYFATLDPEKLVSELDQRRNSWYACMTANGLYKRWRKSYDLYFGRHWVHGPSYAANNSEILRYGDKGEYAAFAVNHYRNLIRHILSITTSQRISFEPVAINTDRESETQARLGRNLLENYFKQKRFNRYLKRAAEYSQIFGKGFVYPFWDTNLGRPWSYRDATDLNGDPVLDHETGEPVQQIVNEGDADMWSPSPFDIQHDLSEEDYAHLQHVEIRTFENKFDLAVQYPHAMDKILNLQTKNEMDNSRFFVMGKINETVKVPVYHFLHTRSKSMPNGRYVKHCGGGCILYDGPIPYSKLPLFRIVPGELLGSCDGYSDAFDIIGLQEAVDVLVSTMFTNLQAQGMQKIYVPDGCTLSNVQISKGLAILRGPANLQPVPLNFTANPKEIFEAIPGLQKMMETTIGINATVRGDPDHNLKSGVALGLVQAMAIQYASDFQQSWAELAEDTGSFLLCDLISPNVTNSRVVAMLGKKNHSYQGEYTGKDIAQIDRVMVNLGNPLLQTTAGKYQLAEGMADRGLIKTAQDFLTLVETGQLDAVTEGLDAVLSQIEQENEFLRQGRSVTALMGDKDILHAQKHLDLIANPDVRNNAAHVKVVMDHIMQHINNAKTRDPLIAMIAGEPPVPQPPPQGPPPGAAPQGPPPGPPVLGHVLHHPIHAPKPGNPMAPQGAPAMIPGAPSPLMNGHGKQRPNLGQLLQAPSNMPHIERLPPNLQPTGAIQSPLK